MKKIIVFIIFWVVPMQYSGAQTRVVKKGAKYDTIIVKHTTATKPAKKPVAKPVAKPVVKEEIVLPTPEFINQPYYYNTETHKLINLAKLSLSGRKWYSKETFQTLSL